MDPPVTRYVQRDGHALAYQVSGDGDPTVVWFFEIGLHPDLMWTDPHLQYLFERAGGRRRNVILLRRGVALSDPTDHVPTLDEQASDVLAVMDAEGIADAVLLGLGSTCGPVVMLAARHPERVRGLVLDQPYIEGLVRCDDTTPPGWEGADLAGFVTGVRAAYAAWGSGRTLQVWDTPVDSPLNRRLMGLLERSTATPATACAHLEWALRVNCWDALGSVQCPTRVLHPGGSLRPPEVARRIADAVPGGSMHVLRTSAPGASLGEAWLPVLEEVEELIGGTDLPVDVDRFLGCVLFTDIVGSTELLARLGDHDYRDLRAAHECAVRDAVDGAGGRLVNVVGDGTFSVFDSAVDAVRCAETIVRGVAELGIVVRVGVHSGSLERSGTDLTGMAVHAGARIGALAGAGEIRVSNAVRDLAVGSGLTFTPRGTHTLKGVPGRWPLFALSGTERPVVPRHRPSLSTLDRAVLTAARRTPQVLRAAVRLAYARQPGAGA
ncbi:adenylate/guanylate cyclase domain-containing protein [Rhodococcus triatomae]